MLIKKHPFFDIVLFVLFIMAGLFLSQFLAIAALLPFHQFDIVKLMNHINQPLAHPEAKTQLLFIQGISTFCAFVLAPWAFIRWQEDNFLRFVYPKQVTHHYVLQTIVLVLVVTPFISFLVGWNESIQLPEKWGFIEQWAKEKEDHLKDITQLLTNLANPFELCIGLLVIAFLPALGEELVFRGYLQNKLRRLGASPHLAIWSSAILFSAIHLQFYGFVPRMVLGALFGYVYFFTGQFHLPVIAHFTNNAMMLVMLYLRNHGHISYDVEKDEQVSVELASVSFISTGLLVCYLHRNAQKEE